MVTVTVTVVHHDDKFNSYQSGSRAAADPAAGAVRLGDMLTVTVNDSDSYRDCHGDRHLDSCQCTISYVGRTIIITTISYNTDVRYDVIRH